MEFDFGKAWDEYIGKLLRGYLPPEETCARECIERVIKHIENNGLGLPHESTIHLNCSYFHKGIQLKFEIKQDTNESEKGYFLLLSSEDSEKTTFFICEDECKAKAIFNTMRRLIKREHKVVEENENDFTILIYPI